jgi:light-regulated signal transduction histidine kinase (bacteriophytochrome)
MRRISDSAGRMTRMIDSLLNLSRIGRQSLAMEPVNVGELVRQIVAEQVEASAVPPVAVTIGSLPECTADPALLRQVWVNLIANAFKYSGKRERPVIEIGWQPEPASYYVRDNGAGFDMQYAPDLFQPFRRLHNQEQFEGSGVGLSTVQRIVERHGGRIWAEAAVDQGATFYFSIPPGGG